MRTYNVEERFERFRTEVKMGIIQPFMIKERARLDSSIPEFAEKEIIRKAEEEYGEDLKNSPFT